MARCLRCDAPLSATGECGSCRADAIALGMPWIGLRIAGRYTVLARLRQGPASVVWAARDAETGVEVVLKALSPSHRALDDGPERVRREARALLRIDHDAIVRLIDLVEHDGAPCLVLSCEDGETLRRRLARGEPLALSEALDAAAALADGLAAAHGVGVVHRDVKPENVLLAMRGGALRPRLIDFGIAQIEPALSITGEGELLGTPGYLAPECITEGRADASSDVYSLGVTLYEMLSLELPHEGRSAMELLRRKVDQDPIPLRARRPDLPEAVEQVVGRAIARRSVDRPATMADFRDVLRAVREVACA